MVSSQGCHFQVREGDFSERKQGFSQFKNCRSWSISKCNRDSLKKSSYLSSFPNTHVWVPLTCLMRRKCINSQRSALPWRERIFCIILFCTITCSLKTCEKGIWNEHREYCNRSRCPKVKIIKVLVLPSEEKLGQGGSAFVLFGFEEATFWGGVFSESLSRS